VDTNGDTVGAHSGFHQFTVGQRRGLRLGVPADDGKPRYVLDISPVTNTVTVGPQEALQVRTIKAGVPTWTGAAVVGAWSGLVQVRAHGQPMQAEVTAAADDLEVTLDAPAVGIAPGQAVVLYQDDRVVGSATITGTRP
jgi:tRNA-specific 2-thiouridylase